jgi:general secretion pathway protein G
VPVGGIAVALMVLSSAVAAKSTLNASMAQIQMLGTALDTFRDDVGRYPSDIEGLLALMERPATAIGWDGPYLKRQVPPDPWGQPFVYHAPARFAWSGSYDLYSTGRNLRDEQGGGDDITSWSGVPCGYSPLLGPVSGSSRVRVGVVMVLGVGIFIGWHRSGRRWRRRIAALSAAIPVAAAAFFAAHFSSYGLLAAAALSVGLVFLCVGSVWPTLFDRGAARWSVRIVTLSSAAGLLGFWAWDAWLRC